MNIVNLLGLVWMMFTWSILKLVTLPEDKLLALQNDKTKKKDSISNFMLKSSDSFDDNSLINLKLKSLEKSDELKPEKID